MLRAERNASTVLPMNPYQPGRHDCGTDGRWWVWREPQRRRSPDRLRLMAARVLDPNFQQDSLTYRLFHRLAM
jgi:hypothetical protein